MKEIGLKICFNYITTITLLIIIQSIIFIKNYIIYTWVIITNLYNIYYHISYKIIVDLNLTILLIIKI